MPTADQVIDGNARVGRAVTRRTRIQKAADATEKGPRGASRSGYPSSGAGVTVQVPYKSSPKVLVVA